MSLLESDVLVHRVLDATPDCCDPPNAAPVDDEYDEMEEWFSSSFPAPASAVAVDPRAGSAARDALKCGSDTSFGGSDKQDPGSQDTSPAEANRAEEGDADEYEIDFGPSVSCGTYNEQPLAGSPMGGTTEHSTSTEAHSAWSGIVALPTELEQVGEPNMVTVAVAQTKIFTRRQRTNDLDDPSSSASSGCGRCRSNLNGKLIVRCASCSFRQHLYCFVPPLKQHPAFQEQLPLVAAQGKRVHVRPSANVIARWNCGECRQKLFANQAPEDSKPQRFHPRISSDRVGSLKPAKASQKVPITEGNLQYSPTPVERTTLKSQLMSERNDSEENVLDPVQDKWRRSSKSDFDWYAFRTDKAQRIASQSENLKPDELVYYSKPYADFKKTALSWMERAEQQKTFKRQRELTETKMLLPQKRNVMRRLTEKELVLIKTSLLRRKEDAAEEMKLFDDTLAYQFDISLSRIRFLRQPRPVVEAPPASANEKDEEGQDTTCIALLLLLKEMTETIGLTAEDADANSLHGLPKAFTYGKSAAKVKWAVVGTQSTFVRWSYEAKLRERSRKQQDLAEEKRIQRQMKATNDIRFLRSCVRSIVLLMRKLQSAQVKKQLLLALQEASEDSQVANSVASDAEKVKKLAKKRIQCFFLHRVRRYVALKKQVMSRRILHWWRRKYLHWRWCETATIVRERNRERASRVVQRAYRQFRTKRIFREILEKHALRKVKMFLRSWLMARVIKKEKTRVEIRMLAVSMRIADCDAPNCRPDATIFEILYALGMGLYRAGDFWNAACVLERVWRLDSVGLDWEGRLALAYSHHMTWYSSYDAYNLTQSYETYCSALNDFFQRTSQNALGEIDSFVLQDTAVVMMHMENFGGSLRLLARLIQFFAQHEAFSLWLLLAAVQLQQRGEWVQSVEYLTYIQDMPPSPYLERDILCLCAIGLERQKKEPGSRSASREAWSAALRQWNLTQKELRAFEERDLRSQSRKLTAHSTFRKWEMLNDFAQRAVAQGHYLLACRLMLFMLELHPSGGQGNSDDPVEQTQHASVWWSLADMFRHLGHLDLYVNATKRSHLCVEPSDAFDAGCDRERVADWTRQAELQAHSFQCEVDNLSVLELVRKIHVQYSQM